MPLFRRRREEDDVPTFMVGVDGHRVAIGGSQSGCVMLPEIDAYVELSTKRARSTRDGRDTVGVLNAKMDYVDMVDAAVAVVTLAMEELVEQGYVSADEIPDKVSLERLDREFPTYEYIQAIYTRAQLRLEYVRKVDALLRERGIAVLEPVRTPEA